MALPSVRPTPAAMAYEDSPPSAGGGNLGVALLGLGVGVLVLAVTLYLYLTTGSGKGPSEPTAAYGSDPTTSTTPNDQRPTGATVRELAPLPSGATEVDRPDSFDYIARPPSCAAETLVTDDLKKVALAIDEEIRRGATISWSDEKRIGDAMIGKVATQVGGRLVKSGPIPDYLTGIAEPLRKHVNRNEVEYHFYLLEGTDIVNAFTLPGGHIVVTQALLDAWIENEAQLATILGHEIAHADLRHPVAVLEALRALGAPEDEAMAQAVLAIARLPYSAAEEENADAYGSLAMHEAGYSVFQAVALWDKRAAQESRSPRPKAGPKADPLGALLEVAIDELENLTMSHPYASRRACLVRREASRLYHVAPRDIAYVGQTNFRRSIPMMTRVF